MNRITQHTLEIFSSLVIFVSALLSVPACSAGQDDAVQVLPGAVEALHEYDLACVEEGGKLWGASLCGPMLVVDPASRIVTANAADTGGLLQPSGDLFVGEYPKVVRPDEVIPETIRSMKRLLEMRIENLMLFTAGGRIVSNGREALATCVDYLEGVSDEVLNLHEKSRILQDTPWA